MSTKNFLPSKNRIAPQYQKFNLVLFLFLSSIIFSPLLAQSSSLNDFKHNSFQEELQLFQEKFEVISAKGNSLISSLELKGGKINIPFDFSSSIFTSINQIDFIICNQSLYSNIWTNPFWQYPNGLIVRIVSRTANFDRLTTVFNYLNSIVFDVYGLNLTLYNFKQLSQSQFVLSLIAPISNEDAIPIFKEIFTPYDAFQYGNMASIIYDLLQKNPPVFAFGYSIRKSVFGVNSIIRKCIIGSQNQLMLLDNQFQFNFSSIYGTDIIPNPTALVSKFIFRIPFYVNVSNINPRPNNLAPDLSGTFEWILKYFTQINYNDFDMEIVYSPQLSSSFQYPEVIITNSYSDILLENSGVLNMTYTATNLGNVPAYNTTLRTKIPQELEKFVTQGIELPVLEDDLQIIEAFNSYIYLDINYLSYDFSIPILEVNGWYENLTLASLARWMDNTSFSLDEYTTIYCTNGISIDLYESVMTRIQPILDNYTTIEIVTNQAYFEPLLRAELSEAVNEAYSIVFSEFYYNKSIFQFSTSDFTYQPSLYGNYLECILPYLAVNETKEIFWQISDIPTSSDIFGAFSITTEYSGSDEYAVFTTKESDYKSLILSYFIQINSAGRFLSFYDTITEAFISLGSTYSFSDVNGLNYYGLTNGLNFQFGDDEAVLESSLTSSKSIYRVGEQVPLILNITNFGSIAAQDIHVDIVNLRLNSYWQPTDVVVVKSFDIDGITASEKISEEFVVKANSYIGLNTYVALISFISDKDQLLTEIENPWTGVSVPWIYSGETKNIVSSTLCFGILLPPVSLQNQARPSFPLPELSTKLNYVLSEDGEQITITYEIKNDGLSPTEIFIHQFLHSEIYTIESIDCYLDESEKTLFEPIVTQKAELTVISYVNTTINPGEKIVISTVFTDLGDDFVIPPLILDYISSYQIYQTNFESVEDDSQNNESPQVKLASANVSENPQNSFNWVTFSPLIRIQLSPSPTGYITYSPLHWIYPIISTTIVAAVVLVIFVISKLRK